jgi:predicted aspartyl protease
VATNVRKVTLAITNEEYAWALRRAKGEGTSVSAVLSAAAKEKRHAEEQAETQRQAWAEIVAYVTNGAQLTSEELAAAEKELNGTAPKRRRASTRGEGARITRGRRALREEKRGR